LLSISNLPSFFRRCVSCVPGSAESNPTLETGIAAF